MSIATDITGGGGSGSASQLLDLLANPDAYKTKLQAMESATAEYKKYVEAIGPASEIVADATIVPAATPADRASSDLRGAVVCPVAATVEGAAGLVSRSG